MMRSRPFALAACLWIIGYSVAYTQKGTACLLAWLGISCMLPLIGYLMKKSWKHLLIYWLILSVAMLYWQYSEGNNRSLIPADDKNVQAGEVFQIKGTVNDPPEIDGDRVRFMLLADDISHFPQVQSDNNEKLAVQLTLATEDEIAIASTWRRGDIISLIGTLELPNIATNFGGFDYRAYLHKQGIHWLFKAQGASSLTTLGQERWSKLAFLAIIDQLRQHIGGIVDELFPDWQGGYMKGLIIGLTDDLLPEKYDQFTSLGMTHILAISGSHVAINISLIFGLLRVLRVTKERAFMIVFWLLPLYVLLTGFTPSVIRAGLMTMLGIYLLRKGLFKDGLNILGAVAIAMLLWQPYYLLNISFQLSFAVTAGIMIFTPLLKPYLLWIPASIRSGIAITLAAEMVSFPLTLYYFNQYSLLSMVANLVLVPVISAVTLPAGTMSLLLGSVWIPLGKVLAYVIEWINIATFSITKWLSELSGFMTYWKSPPLLWILFYYLILYSMFYLQSRYSLNIRQDEGSYDDTVPLQDQMIKNQSITIGALGRLNIQSASTKKIVQWTFFVCIIIGMLIIAYRPLNQGGIGHVQFIDVGQGDCILITTPGGKNILVDGGGTVSFRKPKDEWKTRKVPFEVGAKTVVPLLKKRGIHALDIVIMTHADQDHIGGLQAVLSQIPVRALVMNGSLSDSNTLAKLMETALTKDIPIYSAYRGMGLSPDKSTVLDFVYPEAKTNQAIPYVKDQNHESIVFYLTMDGVRFLFTGDMDIASEDEIMELATSSQQLQADVIKIAHHGSKTSTSPPWLKAVNPKLAVISVGGHNSYGHPYPTVLQQIEEQGAGIYRTDRHGEVQMKVQRGQLSLRKVLP